MSFRFMKLLPLAAPILAALAVAAPAEAGTRYGGWHYRHHVRHVGFGFYAPPYYGPASYVAYEPVYWPGHRYHRYHRKVCIRFPCR